MSVFYVKTVKIRWGLSPHTPLASSGWGFHPHTPGCAPPNPNPGYATDGTPTKLEPQDTPPLKYGTTEHASKNITCLTIFVSWFGLILKETTIS